VEIADDGTSYRAGDGAMHTLETERHILRTRGGADTPLDIQYARDPASGLRYPLVDALLNNVGRITPLPHNGTTRLGLEWVGLDPSTDYAGVMRLALAQDVPALNRAVDAIGLGLHIQYATADGHIGYRLAGRLPLRDPGAAFLPTAASDGRYDWHRYAPQERMPRLMDPSSHVVVTANNMVAAEGADGLPIGHLADQGYRAARIAELLAATPAGTLTAEDVRRIQTDTHSALAARIALHLAAHGAPELAGWDANLAAGSRPAALYEATAALLARDYVGEMLGGDAAATGLYFAADVEAETARYLVVARARWMPGGSTTRRWHAPTPMRVRSWPDARGGTCIGRGPHTRSARPSRRRRPSSGRGSPRRSHCRKCRWAATARRWPRPACPTRPTRPRDGTWATCPPCASSPTSGRQATSRRAG